LVLTDIVYKAISLVLLTPLVGGLFRLLVAISGSALLSDVDILFFFLGPVGWICSISVGALWLGIVALEQASLMGIICAKKADKNLGPVRAIRFAFANAWPVIRVTARIVALTLLTATPFLGLAAAVYLTLLSEYDINYYLKEKPPVWAVAVGIGVILMLSLVVLLLRLFTGWFFALPLVLFENVSPRDALKSSARRSHGHRRTLLYWIVGWFLTMAALSALATGIVAVLGRSLIPGSTDSLRLLVLAVGVTMLLWAVVSLTVNLLSTWAFAAILYNLYWELGGGGSADALRPDFVERIAEDSSFQMTRKQLVVGGVVAVVVAVAVGAVALQSVRLEDEVTIMAHRGSSKAAPENTVAAIRKAIEDGAEWVEIDVQETADGEVVVFHDSDFMRLARVKLKVWDARIHDLKDIDIGSWFAPEFKDERVPTLAKVLDECKGKIRVNIELKYYGHDVQLEQRIADIVESSNMAPDVVVMSLKRDGVRKMKSIRPHWKVGLLMSASVGDLKQVQADFLAVNARFADRKLIRSAHDSGKEVYVWTVNDAPTMSAMMSRGVDGLLTDKPALARSVLEQRAQMSVPERLVLELAGVLGRVPETGEQ
jgi:glycerophosphoryl diester phosphodiesterase